MDTNTTNYVRRALASTFSAEIRAAAGAKYQPFKEAPCKDEFDEWLARIVCYAFSLPATAFTRQVNRATAETTQEAALNEGKEECIAIYADRPRDLPGMGSDMMGRIRRCVRECAERQGCYGF